ncbi:MAG: type I phosphomannose isomerase catalytic subunit [Phycisphaerae bacterium]
MYPLKFKPVFQKRIWGGQRLRALLGKPAESGAIGEAWELADLPAGTVKGDSAGGAPDGSLSSVITNGTFTGRTLRQLLADAQLQAAIMGSTPLSHGHFPLLVKFLDAQQDLSVQVHPSRAYAAAHPDAHLKSEAWYVLHAEPGAKIYKGLKPGVTRQDFRAALDRGEVDPVLNAIRVRSGDCHYLPSGTVHALGAGILAAEVQTPSDTTFRVFDWNRLGPDGKPRKLHVEEALECIDFAEMPSSPLQDPDLLVSCEFFTLRRRRAAQGAEVELPGGHPLIWIQLDGQAVINAAGVGPTAFTRGETLLLPAAMKQARMKAVTDCAWLEAAIPPTRPRE